MVSKMDETVGRILDRLKKLGIEENTYIFFTSDNGAAEVENDWKLFESSGIYRGMKRDPYEGGIRVPLIAWHPKKIKANTSSDQIGYFADFLPTIADLAGVDPIVTASQMINSIQTIVSRNMPLTEAAAVVTIGSIHGGVRSNIIPESLYMLGTIRTLDNNMKLSLIHI